MLNLHAFSSSFPPKSFWRDCYHKTWEKCLIVHIMNSFSDGKKNPNPINYVDIHEKKFKSHSHHYYMCTLYMNLLVLFGVNWNFPHPSDPVIGEVKVDSLDTSRVEDMVKDIFSTADQVSDSQYPICRFTNKYWYFMWSAIPTCTCN